MKESCSDFENIPSCSERKNFKHSERNLLKFFSLKQNMFCKLSQRNIKNNITRLTTLKSTTSLIILKLRLENLFILFRKETALDPWPGKIFKT